MTETGLFRNLVPLSAGLEIIWDLGFGYWDFPGKAGFGSGYARLGYGYGRSSSGANGQLSDDLPLPAFS
jgi:hypothetical protein